MPRKILHVQSGQSSGTVAAQICGLLNEAVSRSYESPIRQNLLMEPKQDCLLVLDQLPPEYHRIQQRLIDGVPESLFWPSDHQIRKKRPAVVHRRGD